VTSASLWRLRNAQNSPLGAYPRSSMIFVWGVQTWLFWSAAISARVMPGDPPALAEGVRSGSGLMRAYG
jgi:hypothetical protein